ncbi:MAG: putative membrane protein [Alteromonadaceae bacterium]|jgi:putative membrane protein
MDNEAQLKEDIVGNSITNDITTHTWQRLSPIAILYFSVTFIRTLVGQFIFIAPGLLIAYNTIKNDLFFALPIAIFVGVSLFAYALLSFYFFQYRLSDGSIEIRSGVLNKKQVNLPFSRIQNVKIEQPIYYRHAGFACLTLDTAGSVKQEAKVVALKLEFAEKLKQEILTQHEMHIDLLAEHLESTAAIQIPPDETLLNTRTVKDLVIHGITSNRIWIFLGLLAPMYDEIARYSGEFLLAIGFNLGESFNLVTHSWWQVSLYALSMTMFIMLLLTLFSVIGSIMTFYGYTLTKKGDRYIRRSGLFTKHEVTMRLSRLQMITHKRDWLDMLLKRVNLNFEQSNAGMQGMQNASLINKIMVPSIKPAQANALINEVYPNNQLADLPFQAISKRYLMRIIGFIGLPLYLAVLATVLYNNKLQLVFIFSGVFLFLCLLTYMHWLRWGYAADKNYIYVRKGVFGIDYYCFPLYKVQQTSFKQSLFMKRRGLCSIKLVLASGAIDIPFITEEQGKELVNSCLYHIESSGKSWM